MSYHPEDVLNDETWYYPSKVYDRYDEMLNECTPIVKVGMLEYLPSVVLKNVDPIAYRCDINDWLDSLATDGLYCLECELFEDEGCKCEEEE